MTVAEVGHITLPPEFRGSDEQRKALHQVVNSRLPFAVDLRFELVRPPFRAVIVRTPGPPPRVGWAEVLPLIESAPEHEPLIGLARERRPVSADWQDESPNLLVASGAGGGKSALVKAVLAQGLHRGGLAVVLDFKRSSHSWVKGHPGVLYARDIDEIHHALVSVGGMAAQRNRDADEPGVAESWPRLHLVAEEMNATVFKLQSYWAETRDKDDPKISPAIAALRDTLYMGRAAKVTTYGIAQMASARALGGPEARENFATRCLSASRSSGNSFKMLAPEIVPAPKRVKGAGLWYVINAGTALLTRVVWATDEQAAEWSLAGQIGQVDPAVLSLKPLGNATYQPRQAEAVLGLTLRAALTEAPELAPSLDALRKAAQRSGFPEPVGKAGPAALYDPAELAAWQRRRAGLSAVSGSVVR